MIFNKYFINVSLICRSNEKLLFTHCGNWRERYRRTNTIYPIRGGTEEKYSPQTRRYKVDKMALRVSLLPLFIIHVVQLNYRPYELFNPSKSKLA